MPPVTVVLADDHPLYRDGLASAINKRPDLELVGQASNGDEALDLITEHAPDVALLDVKMDVDGPRVMRRMQNGHPPRTLVVFLSAYVDSTLIYSALET